MTMTSRFRPLGAALLAASTILAVGGPVAAVQPDRITLSETALACDDVTTTGGTIRVIFGIGDDGAGGFLSYWAAGQDPAINPATLITGSMTAEVQPDGSITASFDLYLAGDLGLEGDSDPVFVGTAELTVTVAAGEPSRIHERGGVGNITEIVSGIRQELTVSGGSVAVPTAGTFDLAGGACAGERSVQTRFTTRPSSFVETRALIETNCFFETDSGFVFIDAQTGITDTFILVTVLDGDRLYFTEVADPSLTLRGLKGTGILPLLDDPSVVGTVSVDARFGVVERSRARTLTEEGWVSETGYLFAVDGMVSVEAPGLSLELPMDGCAAGGEIGHEKAG